MNIPVFDRGNLADLPPSLRFLDGGGEATRLILARDWSDHPLGAPSDWPAALKVALGLILNSPESMILAWGRDELIFFFNETYAPLLGPRVGWAMGSPFSTVWADGWKQAKPIIDKAFAGRPERFTDLHWRLDDDRGSRDTWWNFSYSRVLDAFGDVAGLFVFTNETTSRIFADTAAKESQEALLRETAQQRLSLQHMPGFAAVLVGPDHVYDYVNDAYVAMTGERGFIGRSVREVFSDLEGQGFFESLDEVYRSGNPYSAEASPISFADERQQRFIDLLFQPVRGEDGEVTGIFVGGYDVSERVRAERRRDALLKLDDVLRDEPDTGELAFAAARIVGETLGVARVGYGAVDADERTVTIERDWSAPGFASVAGLHRFEDFGSHIDDLLRGKAVTNEDVRADARTATNAAMSQALGIAAHLDVPIMQDGRLVADMFAHADQPRIWTDGEIGLMREAAQRTRAAVARRLAERELSASEEFNRRVLASSPDCIKVLSLDARLHFMSEGGMCVMEVDDFCSVEGTYWPDLWQGEEHPKALAAVQAAKHGAPGRFQGSANTMKGTPRWWDVTVTPMNGPDGHPQQLLCVSRDITEQRRTEEQLRELNETLEARVAERTTALEAAHEQLRQSQKMEAVGQLTGGLAHDFNNLLAGISGSLELIGMRLAQGRTADVEKYATAAQGAANRAAALTHRLLAFSRRQTLAPKPTDVKQLVAGMAELIGRTAGPHVALETVNGVGLWPSLIDPSQLENAILNLCINARDAMPDGGTITIETGNRWLDHRMAQERGLEPGQYISLCVSDTGTGMTPDVIERAFDPFFTTKPIGVGTGLGLSMIYGFAKQSGGGVSIYSEPGSGTNVCIYLPRHLGDVQPTAASAELADAPRGEGETVLVVDDEPTVRMLVAEVLADLGYTAIEAEDGAAGMKVLNSGRRMDLLVTDVGLPGGMNGRQVADAARAVRAGLKVLFITGYAENAVLSHGHLDPGMHVMTKPFAMEALATRIRTLIEQPL